MPKFRHLGWNPKLLDVDVQFIFLDSGSRHIANKNGDNGSPCLRPRLPEKCPYRLPFIAIENEVDVTHSIIQLLNFIGKFNEDSSSLKNSQSMVSKAFCESTFRVHLDVPYFREYFRSSSCAK